MRLSLGVLTLTALVVMSGEVAVAAQLQKSPKDASKPYRECMHAAARTYRLNSRLLHAIVRVENGDWNPYAISVNRHGQGFPQAVRSYEEAVHVVTVLWQRNENFDVGLAQVNTINMERFKVHPVLMLDPCTNLRYAARILRESIDRHGYNWTAIERYNGINPKYPWKIHQALKEIPQ
jgi:soluble lytic murein transglycosylase-like protein